MNEKTLKRVSRKIITILSGIGFTNFIVIFFVLQAAWIAFSFAYPMFYDENFHVQVANLFSSQLSPILSTQPESYDKYGLLTNGGATLFHYLMSFPYRLITALTDNLAIQVISLRLIGIAMVAFGLILYAKLFELVGARRLHINLALAVFILLPIVPFVAATVNYDNMLFLLTPAYFISAVKIIKDSSISWMNIASLIIIGCTASLVKYTFLPIFLASVIFLTLFLLKRYGKTTLVRIVRSVQSTKKSWLVYSIVLLVITVTLFSGMYIRNTFVYGSPTPSCQKVLSKDRCLKSGIELRNINAIETRDTRPLVQAPEFISLWTTQMINWSTIVGARPLGGGVVASKPLPVIYTTLFVLTFAGIGMLLMAWYFLKKSASMYFLLTMSGVLVAAVFLQNYMTYESLHVPYAIQPRYLLTIIPIILIYVVIASNYIFRRTRLIKAALLIAIALLFTQGGGVATAIISSEDGWYWQNPTVIKLNHAAKKIVDPLVKSN